MVDTVIFIIAVQVLIAMLAGAALYYRRRAGLLAAALADTREAHAAAVRGINVATTENAKLRRLRPLVLNGRIYYSYRVMPETIYKN